MEKVNLIALKLPGFGRSIDEPQNPPTGFLPGGGEYQTLGDIVSVAIFVAILIASVILGLYLIIGALRLIFSGGDPKNIEGARGMIVTAIIGFIIVFAAFWLVRVIETVVGGGITSFIQPAYAIDIGSQFQIGGKTANQLFPTLGLFGQKFAPTIVSFLFIVGGLAAFFMVVIGGLRYILSGGDEKAVAAARGQITLAIVGLIVLFATFLILLIIQTLTKFPILG